MIAFRADRTVVLAFVCALALGLSLAACGRSDERTGSAGGGAAKSAGHQHGIGAGGGHPGSEGASAAAPNEADSDAIAFYTCAMHPSVKSADPGTCPICSMTLTPVTRHEVATGTITIPPQRQQEIGIRTTPVERTLMNVELRAVGRVTYDERLLSDVTLKYRGWVRELFVNTSGQYVEQGKPLFTLYSPELLAAQRELLNAVASRRAATGTSAPGRADYLVDAARERLRLWDLSDAQIEDIASEGRALMPVRCI